MHISDIIRTFVSLKVKPLKFFIMQYTDLSTKVHSLKKGQLGVNIVAVISCDKKFLASGSGYIGRVKKVTLGTNIRLVSYEGKVAAMKDSDASFTPAALKGMKWVDYPYFKESLSSGKRYLCVHYRPCDERTEFRSFYLLDGRETTPIETSMIEAHMKKSGSYSVKQASVGIVNEEEQTKVVQYEVDGIKYFGTDKALATDLWNGLR